MHSDWFLRGLDSIKGYILYGRYFVYSDWFLSGLDSIKGYILYGKDTLCILIGS